MNIHKITPIIAPLALKLFEHIKSKTDLNESKKSSGGSLILKELHVDDSNFIGVHYQHVLAPSSMTKYRAHELLFSCQFGDGKSSGDSSRETQIEKHGCIGYFYEKEKIIHVSFAGLGPEENLYIAIHVMAVIVKGTSLAVYDYLINRRVHLPKCFLKKDHYLYIGHD